MIRVPLRLFAALGSLAAVAAPVGHASLRAQEVVQALPDPAAEDLNEALRRLSRNPESVPALVAAGRASLQLDDVAAALGFFNRAQAVAPEDGRVLAGLGLVAVRRGEAVTALQLFRNAEAAGERMAPYAAERGLAYDLVGQNDRAQRNYRIALSQDESPEVLRRLALSYAISGDAEASEATLLPLLQRQDRAAYRSRAFALAINGRDEEAVAIAETMLPARLSQRLAPYLRYMSQLTRAQQAAAANLGRFPDASEVGRDGAQIAAYSDEAASSTRTRQRPGDRLEPQGEPLGPSSAQGTTNRAQQAELPGELPAITSLPSAGQTTVAQGAPPAPVQAQVAEPSFSLVDTPGSTQGSAGATLPAPAPSRPTEPEPAQIDLAQAFADFTLEGRPTPSMAGAVDITTIDPPRERPAPVAPPPPVHPARHWVQVATGQDTSAFRFDWRRIVRGAGGLLDDAEAFTSRWGQTNRLLTGPYASAREAQEMVSKLAGEGVDSFRFSSEEGEQIQSLD